MKKINPWLKYAMDDKNVIENIQETNFYRPVCFHAQQLAEKMIKALIYYQNKIAPKTHNLKRLYQITDMDLQISDIDLEFLSSIYIDTRYPPDIGLLPQGEPTSDDAHLAIKISTKIYEEVTKIICSEEI